MDVFSAFVHFYERTFGVSAHFMSELSAVHYTFMRECYDTIFKKIFFIINLER